MICKNAVTMTFENALTWLRFSEENVKLAREKPRLVRELANALVIAGRFQALAIGLASK